MKNKSVLITGGTGSWGLVLIQQLLEKGVKEIRVLARNEFLQFEMGELFKNPLVKCVIGDIRDRECVKSAMEGIDVVFHLAALKHVPICEEQPLEAIKTNVLGTVNIVEEALVSKVKKVIYLSTDKVAEPSSTYGLTKAIAEKIVLNANTRSDQTQFSVLRSGNVLGTHGSVIPVFKKQLELGEKIKLTHKEMTRFFIGLREAVNNLIEVSEVAEGGEIFVMKMASIKIAHIAEVILEAYKKDLSYLIETRPRKGEKLSEVLVTKEEGSSLYNFNEKFYVILTDDIKASYKKKNLQKVNLEKYSSEDTLLGKEEVRELLKSNHYIGEAVS